MTAAAWSWLLTSIGVASLFCAGSRPRIGWAIAFLAQFLWMAYAIITRQYGFFAGAVLYAIVFARNWRIAPRDEAARGKA